jgi:hypothetical protein
MHAGVFSRAARAMSSTRLDRPGAFAFSELARERFLELVQSSRLCSKPSQRAERVFIQRDSCTVLTRRDVGTKHWRWGGTEVNCRAAPGRRAHGARCLARWGFQQ